MCIEDIFNTIYKDLCAVFVKPDGEDRECFERKKILLEREKKQLPLDTIDPG